MSNAPQLDRHAGRDPVAERSILFVLQVVAPSSASPGSGVPAAASCHSSLRSSRLPDRRHACAARNQEVQVVGLTPATDAAYTPGDGGSEPGSGVHCPSLGKVDGWPAVGSGTSSHPRSTAPPATRSSRVAFPDITRLISDERWGSMRQTLAS